MVLFVETLGEPAYRGRQLFAALQHRRLRSFDDITDLPKEFRTRLNDIARAATLKVESQYLSDDGTRRYLMKTHDSLPVETVFIPEERRDTICFSSQSGCPLQCTFCLTAQLGLLRSLTAGEIVEQIQIALNDAYGTGIKPPRGTNLVAMGAGEPLLNLDQLLQALRVMADPHGMHIVPNRVTVSTAGVVPRILDLGAEAFDPFFTVARQISFFEEARRRGIDSMLLFIADPHPRSAQFYGYLHQAFPRTVIVPVQNEANVSARGYSDLFPPVTAERGISIPRLNPVIKGVIDKPHFSFASFMRKPADLRTELHAWTERVFVEFRELELRVMLRELKSALPFR